MHLKAHLEAKPLVGSPMLWLELLFAVAHQTSVTVCESQVLPTAQVQSFPSRVLLFLSLRLLAF